MVQRICKGECKELKPLTDYYFNETRRAYFGICKVCTLKKAKSRRTTEPTILKLSCKCGEHRPEMFSNQKRSATGKQSVCKMCATNERRRRTQANTHRIANGKEERLSKIRKRFKMWQENGVFE